MLSFFLRDVLDEIFDLIESFPGDFPTYAWAIEAVSEWQDNFCSNSVLVFYIDPLINLRTTL